MTGEPVRVRVEGERPYEALVGAGVAGELAASLDDAVARVAILHQLPVSDLARSTEAAVEGSGRAVLRIELPEGESAKTTDVAARCWSELARAGFTRTDVVVGVGGGAATDLAGFVAATWLRGVDVVLVPTTLLGMVDAAFGGKTGVNLPEGKNLVGSFHPPRAVYCDTTTLTTLPPDEYAGGLAEVVKCGFIADPAILDLVEDDLAGARTPGGPHTVELIERSLRVKARVVSEDLREAGLREILNYGHTLGHAIENAEGYRWRHGAAVSVGMVYAAELANLELGLPADVVTRHRRILGELGLPITYAGSWDRLRDTMRVDKKSRGDRLRFVLLQGVGAPTVVTAPDPAHLNAAYERLAGDPAVVSGT